MCREAHLPLCVCLRPHQTEADKQRGQQHETPNAALASPPSAWQQRARPRRAVTQEVCALRSALRAPRRTDSMAGSCGGALGGSRALPSPAATLDSETRLQHLPHGSNSQAQLGHQPAE